MNRDRSSRTEGRPDGDGSAVVLYWIPLGAGGTGFVRMNGRIYEGLLARKQRRRPLALFHTALRVHTPAGSYVVETMWPSPAGDPAGRGVVATGPVFARPLSLTRVFRYEVRRWQDGNLPDASAAVGGPRTASIDAAVAQRVLDLAPAVPALTWGRDPVGCGDMWNSNSVISWLLACSGLPMHEVVAPDGGRAPGWEAGLVVAQQSGTTPP